PPLTAWAAPYRSTIRTMTQYARTARPNSDSSIIGPHSLALVLHQLGAIAALIVPVQLLPSRLYETLRGERQNPVEPVVVVDVPHVHSLALFPSSPSPDNRSNRRATRQSGRFFPKAYSKSTVRS